MSLRIVEGPSFVSLERRLLDEVAAGADRLPPRTRWVATPNATVAGHLRRRLAEEAQHGCLAGIRVLPLSRFARLLAQEVGHSPGPRWSPRLQVELAWVLQQLPRSESRLAEASRNPNFLASLVEALLELAEAGIGLLGEEQLEELAEELAEAPLAAETVRFFGLWWRHVDAAELEWEPFSLAKLCRLVRETDSPPLLREEGGSCPVWVHGFYDFIDLNLELVLALAHRTEVTVLLPTGPASDSPWYRFVSRVAEVLELRYGPTLREAVSPRSFEGWPARAQEDRAGEERPVQLSRRRAAGVEAEVVAAAAQVRRWLDRDASLQPHEVLVAAPDPQNYLLAVRRVFPDFGLPVAVVGAAPLADRRLRELNLLQALWRTRASAAALFAWWREFPEVPERRGVHIDALEEKARRLGVSGGLGWRRWMEVRAGFAGRGGGETRPALPPLEPAEAEFLADLTDTWVLGPGQDETLDVRRATAWLERWRRWLGDSGPVDAGRDSLGHLQEDGRALRLAPDDLFELVRRGTPPSRPADEIDRRGVRFASFMRARGLTARRVVLLGLSVDRFPFPPAEGPLLPEEIRARLGAAARSLGFWWRSPGELPDEMRLLLLLLCSAEEVHWVLPELDGRGRPTTVTPWLQQLLEDFASAEPEMERMPLAPRGQAEVLWREDRERGGLLPPAWATFLDLGGEARTRPPDDFAGAQSGDRAHDFIRVPEDRSSFSVTSLEVLAKCPFRFWADRILRVEPLVEIPWEGSFASFERGAAVHAVLEELSRQAQAAGCSLREWVAGRSLEFSPNLLAAAAPRVWTLSPAVREALWKEVLSLVQEYADALVQGRCADGRPLAGELRLERSWPGRPGWLVTGVVDRVDAVEGGVRVVDYKTGKNPLRVNVARTPGWSVGWYLQPFLYPWLWEQGERGPASFAYIYIDTGQVKEVETGTLEGGREWLEELGELLASSRLLPTPREAYEALGYRNTDPCHYCPFPSLCRKFEKSPAEHLAALESLPSRRRRRLEESVPGGEKE
ncbi:MAG: hypothetical protein Kow00109_03950 [Acidobacteriota bacterium]